jgi:hypothetical protein
MTGWVSIGGVTPQVYDLLDLTGGVNVLCWSRHSFWILGKYVWFWEITRLLKMELVILKNT